MRRFVHGQGTQEDRKPCEEPNEIDIWQRADSVPQAAAGLRRSASLTKEEAS
jgi:hypothetical protein